MGQNKKSDRKKVVKTKKLQNGAKTNEVNVVR